jgi:hypothetical protein
MLAEWSVECSAEDPVLVVPWKAGNGAAEAGTSEVGGAEFIDLRANPYDLHRIPEAEQHQPLMQALRALNATRSAVFTAKCDAWALDAEEVAQLLLNLDECAVDAPSGFASYIDLVWRERSLFTSFHQQEQILHRLIRHAAALNRPCAALDCVLRPAFVDLDGPREGYAVSMYVKALGGDPQGAWEEWAAALGEVVALLRGKDLAGAIGSKARAG